MGILKDNLLIHLSLSKDRLVAQFGLLVFATYLFKSGVETPWPSFPVILGLLLGLMLTEGAVRSRWFWLSAAAVLLLDMIKDYFVMPNHHFVLFYFCLVLFIAFSFSGKERNKILIINSRWVIVGIMFFGAFQKALTPEYATGSFFGSMVLTGEFFKPGVLFFPEIKGIMVENKKMLLHVCATEPSFRENYHFIAPFPHFKQFSVFFAYIVILSELLVALVFTLFESQKWRHILLLSVISGVFITRLETGFLSILCLFGIAHCPDDWIKCRLVYISFILFFVSLVIIGIGYE